MGSFAATPAANSLSLSKPGFGTPTASSAGASLGQSTSSFGLATSAAPAASKSFSFGTPSASTAAAPSFGTPGGLTTPSFGSGIGVGTFGQTPSASRPQATGTTGTTGGFGGGFGSAAAGVGGSTSTTFGSGLGGGFGSFGQPVAQTQQGQNIAHQDKPSPINDLESLMTSYDTAHPFCRFKHMFYNVVPDDVSTYGKPPNTDDILWNQAVLNNPDPTSLVPVQATGFQDIKERRKMQEQQIAVFENTLKQIQASIGDVSQHHKLKTVSKLEECKRKELEFGIRILRIYKKLEIFRKSGMPLSVDEENLKMTFETMLRELYKPTQYRGRLNDLLSQVRMHNLGVAGDTNTTFRYDSIEEDSLSNIGNYLTEQNEGLSHLMGVIKEDIGDLKLIRDGADHRTARKM